MYFIGYLDSDGNSATKYNLPFIEAGMDEDEVDSILADLKYEIIPRLIADYFWKKHRKDVK